MSHRQRRGILVSGGYSCANRGDWALGASAVQAIQRSDLESPTLLQVFEPTDDVPIEERCETIAMWPSWRKRWHRVGSLGSRNRYYRLQIADMRRHLDDARRRLEGKGAQGTPILWICGGGVMNDVASHGPFTARLGTIAAEEGWEVLMTGQTIGPVRTPRFREGLEAFLRSCRWIGVRDVDSLEQLQAMDGLSAEPVRRLDDVFYMRPIASGFADPDRYQRSTGMPPPATPFVLLTLHAQGGTSAPIGWPEVSRTIEEIERTGRRVVLVNFAGHATPEDRDMAALRSAHPDVALLPWSTDVPSLRELAASADLVVSTRFHGLVFALHAGTPAVTTHAGSYYRTKTWRLMEEWGLERFAADVSEGWSEVPGLVREALGSLEEMREVVRLRRPDEIGTLQPMLVAHLHAAEREDPIVPTGGST
ncbi:MAG: polysaccharide pyruvyl transferase family protein [Phycisphaerales bacterium]|jgi:polysaccharide pyruvyl transferase WcaK-like protein